MKCTHGICDSCDSGDSESVNSTGSVEPQHAIGIRWALIAYAQHSLMNAMHALSVSFVTMDV